DAAFGVPSVVAEVPSTAGARRTRYRIRSAHHTDDEIPHTEAAPGRSPAYPAQRLVEQHEVRTVGRRLSVTLGDLEIGAADSAQQTVHQQLVLGGNRVGTLGHGRGKIGRAHV